MDLLVDVLKIASYMLATITLLLMIYRFWNDSRDLRTITVYLSFLLVLIFGTVGLLGSLVSLVAALGWVLILVVSLKAQIQ